MDDDDFLEHDDPSDALTECAEHFVNGRYGTCAQQAMRIIDRWGLGILAAQLALMSNQRLGRYEDARQIGDAILSRSDFGSWDKTLIGISLGRRGAAKAVLEAPRGKQRCQAYFYHGNRVITERKLEEAGPFLRICVTEGLQHPDADSNDVAAMASRLLDHWPRLRTETSADARELLAHADELRAKKRLQEALDHYDFVVRRHGDLFAADDDEPLPRRDSWEEETLRLAAAWNGKAKVYGELGKGAEALNANIATQNALGAVDSPPSTGRECAARLHPEREATRIAKSSARAEEMRSSWWKFWR